MLVNECRDSFVHAARLLEISTREISYLQKRGVTETVDLSPMFRPYEILCLHYNKTLYNPQILLFPTDRQ